MFAVVNIQWFCLPAIQCPMHETPSLGWSLALSCCWLIFTAVSQSQLYFSCAHWGKHCPNALRPDSLPNLYLYCTMSWTGMLSNPTWTPIFGTRGNLPALVHILESTWKLYLLIALSVMTILQSHLPRLECLCSPLGHQVQMLSRCSVLRCAGPWHAAWACFLASQAKKWLSGGGQLGKCERNW